MTKTEKCMNFPETCPRYWHDKTTGRTYYCKEAIAITDAHPGKRKCLRCGSVWFPVFYAKTGYPNQPVLIDKDQRL